jgi:hypothetical protein
MTIKGWPESVKARSIVQRVYEAYPDSTIMCEDALDNHVDNAPPSGKIITRRHLCMDSLSVCCKEARGLLVGGPFSRAREKFFYFFHG